MAERAAGPEPATAETIERPFGMLSEKLAVPVETPVFVSEKVNAPIPPAVATVGCAAIVSPASTVWSRFAATFRRSPVLGVPMNV